MLSALTKECMEHMETASSRIKERLLSVRSRASRRTLVQTIIYVGKPAASKLHTQRTIQSINSVIAVYPINRDRLLVFNWKCNYFDTPAKLSTTKGQVDWLRACAIIKL